MGCGLWVGVVGSWSWIGELKWVVVVDRRLKGVVGRGSAVEMGRGRGWVVAEVAPVGFKSWLGRGRGLLRSCLGFKSAPVMIFF